MRRQQGGSWVTCFELGDPLLEAVETCVRLTAVGFDVDVECFEAGGDVLDCSGQTDDGVSAFAVFVGDGSNAHGTGRDGGTEGGSDDLDHELGEGGY